MFENAEANAKLISKAPSMAAAIRALLIEINDLGLDRLHPLAIQAQHARALLNGGYFIKPHETDEEDV